MALVINPFQSGQASGKVGSLVAGRNRTGAYIRQNAKPVQPRTPTQTLVRYDFTRVSEAFINLSTARIDAWNDFADNYTIPNRLGQATTNSGRNWFIAFTSRLFRLGVSVVLDPPLSPEPSYLPFVSIAQTSAAGPINLGVGTTGTANQSIWVYGTGNLLRSRRFKAGSMRLLSIYQAITQAINVSIVSASALSFGDSSRQFETRSVDEFGRSTAPLRFTVYPAS
jgi:hypothetical protein